MMGRAVALVLLAVAAVMLGAATVWAFAVDARIGADERVDRAMLRLLGLAVALVVVALLALAAEVAR
jgi:hypothetical protein